MSPEQENQPVISSPVLPSLRRFIWIGTVALLLLIILAFFASSFGVNAYLHSEAFRVFLNKKTASTLELNGEYAPVHWSGFSFYSDGYSGRGTEHSPFSELQAEQIRAEFVPRGVFHHAWQIDDVQLQRLRILFGNEPLISGTQAAKPTLVQAVVESSQNSWFPTRLEIHHAQIRETDLDWLLSGYSGNVRQMQVNLETEDEALIANATGGKLFQTGWPLLNIDHAKIRFQKPDLFINDALFKLGDSENIGVSGQVSLDQNRALDLQVKIAGVSVTPFLPVDWRARLKGAVGGDVMVKGNLQELNASGKLTMSDGQLDALPILNQIAVFTHAGQFRSVTLQKATADFLWHKSRLSVSSLLLESEGLIRIEGDFVVENGELNGLFQVGVTPASLRWLPGSQEHVFTQERDGFVWAPVRVSGPLANLKEDLTSRLTSAAGEQIIDDVKGSVEKGTKDMLDLLNPLVR